MTSDDQLLYEIRATRKEVMAELKSLEGRVRMLELNQARLLVKMSIIGAVAGAIVAGVLNVATRVEPKGPTQAGRPMKLSGE